MRPSWAARVRRRRVRGECGGHSGCAEKASGLTGDSLLGVVPRACPRVRLGPGWGGAASRDGWARRAASLARRPPWPGCRACVHLWLGQEGGEIGPQAGASVFSS